MSWCKFLANVLVGKLGNNVALNRPNSLTRYFGMILAFYLGIVADDPCSCRIGLRFGPSQVYLMKKGRMSKCGSREQLWRTLVVSPLIRRALINKNSEKSLALMGSNELAVVDALTRWREEL
jgi:hypothetical protein